MTPRVAPGGVARSHPPRRALLAVLGATAPFWWIVGGDTTPSDPIMHAQPTTTPVIYEHQGTGTTP